MQNNRQFIPTIREWERLYDKWHEKMAKSLWSYGSYHECLEAVHEAFLKAMGLSDHLHLRDELTPKVEGCWYGFLRNQAKGILSNGHSRTSRFESLEGSESAEEDESRAYSMDFDAFERQEFGKNMRKMVAHVCSKSGVDTEKCRAFISFVLDDESGESVVRKNPRIGNTNNLYQVKNRIMNLLVDSAPIFKEAFGEWLAA